MDLETFKKLTAWIMQEAGLDEDTAGDFAAEIGDTPETDAAGLWTATLNGRTIKIRPFNN